jgi:serine/threonine-protein kinase
MPPLLPVKLGEVLGEKYEVESVLGFGGMGAVVAARHIELGTRVAVKFLLPSMAHDEAAVLRFQREARAAVRLRGEHTARVMDVGKLANGAPYLVMELLEGRDLGELIAQQCALGVDEAARYVLQVCESIAEAHGLGIIHRDLKPQNLFLTHRLDGAAVVKVLDFGLARSLDTAGDGEEQRLTRTTDVMGSPAYMSPEQLKRSKDAGVASDIWSLGVCMFELLTGKLPFEAGTLAELTAAVLKDVPRPLRSLRADAPPALEELIARCMHKDPAARFPDVAALAEALAPFAKDPGAAKRVRSILNATRKQQAGGIAPRVDVPTTTAQTQSEDGAIATADTALSVQEKDTRTAFGAGTRREARYGVAIGVGVALVTAVVGAGLGVRFWLSGHVEGAPAALAEAPPPAVPAATGVDPVALPARATVQPSAPAGVAIDASKSLAPAVPATGVAPSPAVPQVRGAPSGAPPRSPVRSHDHAAPTSSVLEAPMDPKAGRDRL